MLKIRMEDEARIRNEGEHGDRVQQDLAEINVRVHGTDWRYFIYIQCGRKSEFNWASEKVIKIIRPQSKNM